MGNKLNITFYNVLFIIATVAAVFYNGVNIMLAKYVAMALFALLFVCALVKSSRVGIDSLFKSWFVWLLVYSLINLLYGFEPADIFPMETAIPLMIAFSSTYLFTIEEDQFRLWFVPLSLIFSYIAYLSVIYGIGSLTVNELSGGVEVAKNQIGPSFTIIAIICYNYAVLKGTPLWQRIVFGVAAIINVYPALFLGCRTALVCFFVVAVFSTFRAYRFKGVFILLLLGLVVVAFFGRDYLNDILFQSFVGARDQTDFSSMTSGRDSNMIESWNYFLNHPLFGFYGSGDSWNLMPQNAHMYLLLHITKWGLLGAIPALALYFSVFKIFIRTYSKRNILIFAILFVAFIESFGEYSPPFGPGSCFTLMYLMVGMFLRDERNNVNQISNLQQ